MEEVTVFRRGSRLSGPAASVLSPGMNATTAVAASSGFWAESIVEGRVSYDILDGWLNKYELPGAKASTYSLDGGVIDTTGILPLLRRGVKSIVAFYNNNDDLAALNSTFAFLFGANNTNTDGMNVLQGPALAQVFPRDHYDAVIRNLTDPAVLRAHLVQLPVLRNPYMGVETPYVLDHLYLVSHQFAPAFVNQFKDVRVAKGLDKDWPNKIAAGMDTFNANMLCTFAQWKIRHHADELANILGDNILF